MPASSFALTCLSVKLVLQLLTQLSQFEHRGSFVEFLSEFLSMWLAVSIRVAAEVVAIRAMYA